MTTQKFLKIDIKSSQMKVALIASLIGLALLGFKGVRYVSDGAVSEGLRHPDGAITTHVDESIAVHTLRVEMERRQEVQQVNLRLQRLEILVGEIYVSTTGRAIPE